MKADASLLVKRLPFLPAITLMQGLPGAKMEFRCFSSSRPYGETIQWEKFQLFAHDAFSKSITFSRPVHSPSRPDRSWLGSLVCVQRTAKDAGQEFERSGARLCASGRKRIANQRRHTAYPVEFAGIGERGPERVLQLRNKNGAHAGNYHHPFRQSGPAVAKYTAPFRRRTSTRPIFKYPGAS